MKPSPFQTCPDSPLAESDLTLRVRGWLWTMHRTPPTRDCLFFSSIAAWRGRLPRGQVISPA